MSIVIKNGHFIEPASGVSKKRDVLIEGDRVAKIGKNLSGDEVIAFCKERLAAYKYPRIVEFLDSLPKGPTGKILKRELR